MIRMIASRQTCGDYGNIGPGGEFECDEATALQLEANGTATRWRPRVEQKAKPTHPNKMLHVAENKRA